jgi:probable O-glycosylation ligase (exosortase A-associated)
MRDIVLALFIFGTIPFILSRPYIGLLAWSWLGYMNPHRLCYGFAYSFPWVMMIAALTLMSFAISKERKKIPMSAISILLFAFLVWTGVTTLLAAEPAAAAEKFQEFAKIMVMVFVTLMMVNTRERMHRLVWMIVVSLGFYGVKGGLFTVLGGGVSHVLGPAGSFISDNNALALALCMTLPFMRYLQLQAPRKMVRIGLGLGMLLTCVAVLGTYSRGGLIGLVIVASALFLKGRRRLAVIVIMVVVGFAAYNFMPPQWIARMNTLQNATKVNTAETRIQSWKFAANLAIHRPLVGGGFDDYKSSALWVTYAPEGAKQRAIHSIYFRVLSEQGFPGLMLFLMLLFVSWRNCSRVRKMAHGASEHKWAYDLASMLQVSLVAFTVAGAFLPMTYFDLVYQLIALSALLEIHVCRPLILPDALARSRALSSTPAAHKVLPG